MSATKKKKHVSKKNKKAWRKFCDITDVEEFLEDQRLEERLGKFDSKPDDELFIVDTGGDTKEDKEEKPLSHKLRKRANLSATPKCFEILLPSSKVQDPNAKRNHVNPIGSKPTALSKITDKRRTDKGVYKKKFELARKNRQLALEKKRRVKQTKQNINKDLWGNDLPELKGMPATLCDEFVSPEAVVHNTLPESRLRSKRPVSTLTTSRSAIELPHPGVSYNPSFQVHQELLKDVVEHEEKMMKREKRLLRVTTAMFSKVTPEEKQKNYIQEMGLDAPEKTDGNESEASNDEYKAINPPVKNKKKDHKARRKQRERLVEAERKRREKTEKKKITDLNKLRKLEQSIAKKEKRTKEVKSKKVAKKIEKAASAAPVLNAHKLPTREPELVAPDELVNSLRHLSSRTNLLRDRYESLQHRGILPGSKIMMKKRRKLKSYFKPGHKVTEKDIGRYVTRSSTNDEKKSKVKKNAKFTISVHLSPKLPIHAKKIRNRKTERPKERKKIVKRVDPNLSKKSLTKYAPYLPKHYPYQSQSAIVPEKRVKGVKRSEAIPKESTVERFQNFKLNIMNLQLKTKGLREFNKNRIESQNLRKHARENSSNKIKKGAGKNLSTKSFTKRVKHLIPPVGRKFSKTNLPRRLKKSKRTGFNRFVTTLNDKELFRTPVKDMTLAFVTKKRNDDLTDRRFILLLDSMTRPAIG